MPTVVKFDTTQPILLGEDLWRVELPEFLSRCSNLDDAEEEVAKYIAKIGKNDRRDVKEMWWGFRFESVVGNFLDTEDAEREIMKYITTWVAEEDHQIAITTWWCRWTFHFAGTLRGDNCSEITKATSEMLMEMKEQRYQVVPTAAFLEDVQQEHPASLYRQSLLNNFVEMPSIIPTPKMTRRALVPFRLVRESQLVGPPGEPRRYAVNMCMGKRRESTTQHFFHLLLGWERENLCKFFVANLPKDPTWSLNKDSDTCADDHYKVLRIEGRIGHLSLQTFLNQKCENMSIKKIQDTLRKTVCIQPMLTCVTADHRSNIKEFEAINYYDVRFDKMTETNISLFQNMFGIETHLYTHRVAYRSVF
jgi:hypothetical protein